MINLFNQTTRRTSLTTTKGVILGIVIAGALALPVLTQAGQPPTKEHPRYKLIDLGTLGGPLSTFNTFSKTINNQGTATGVADTAIPDPFAPNCFGPNCFVQHAFQWENGLLTDLGALAEGFNSFAIELNAYGNIAGESQNGLVDPLTGRPEIYAVLWKNGHIINLGSLGGNGSIAVALNNRNQVVGGAANAVPDPFSIVGAVIGDTVFATQTRAFLWDNGVMHDLGTLGGPDSFGQYVNDRGQVAGFSYTDSTPNDTTGIPTVHPFLWEDGRMLDLGSLGGTFGAVNGLNERGDVVGDMTLPGDEFQHPYLWRLGKLNDLGTFGGNNGSTTGINNAGEVVGVADFPGDVLHNAFLWRKGIMTDLGNLGTTSFAYSINSKGQVVGASRVSRVPSRISAFLWQDGGPMIDLNTLIPANSPLHLSHARRINDRGMIYGIGVPPGVSVDDVDSLGHAFLLIPVGEE